MTTLFYYRRNSYGNELVYLATNHSSAMALAAQTVDIEFLDHVIVGQVKEDANGRGFFSFREAGLL